MFRVVFLEQFLHMLETERPRQCNDYLSEKLSFFASHSSPHVCSFAANVMISTVRKESSLSGMSPECLDLVSSSKFQSKDLVICIE